MINQYSSSPLDICGRELRFLFSQDEKSIHDSERVCIIENLDIGNRIDVDFYLRQVARCGESILMPFGYRIENLLKMLLKLKNLEKMKIS